MSELTETLLQVLATELDQRGEGEGEGEEEVVLGGSTRVDTHSNIDIPRLHIRFM